MDGEGGILVGNPHWVARLNRDGSLDTTFGGPRGDGFITDSGGYIRFTASPNIEAPTLPCFADLPSMGTDIVSDPPWGSFQILPIGGRDFQVRGANAALRDATSFPIPTGLYTYTGRNGKVIAEQFTPFLNVVASNLWAMRAHGWSITSNGKELIPHVEVIWRPTMFIEAWPGPSGNWAHPPYRTNFPYSTVTGDWAPDSVRPRNPIFIRTTDTTGIAMWDMTNLIIPRTYSDAWSSVPQGVWVRSTNDPPSSPTDPDWWDPNSSPSDIAALFPSDGGIHFGGPWGSARWKLITGRFNPCGSRRLYYSPDLSIENVCDVFTGDDDPVYTEAAIWRPRFYTDGFGFGVYGFTDFDAIQYGDRVGC